MTSTSTSVVNHNRPAEESSLVAPLAALHGKQFLPTPSQRDELIFSYASDKFGWRSLMIDLFALGVKLDAAQHKRVRAASEAGGSGGHLCARRALRVVQGGEGPDGEDTLSHLHDVYDRDMLRQRSNRDPFHVAYTRILRGNLHDLQQDPDQQPFVAEIAAMRHRFNRTYHSFVREVCSAYLGVGPDDLYYQASPTLRVCFPIRPGHPEVAMGRPHKDYEYFHQPSEINFWLPCTAVGGANTLHCESAPGREDFHALHLGYGECCRFWGNQCFHYTVPNTTETTRVSLDFRVIPKARFNREFRDCRGAESRFRVGEYYLSSSEAVAFEEAEEGLGEEAGRGAVVLQGAESKEDEEAEGASGLGMQALFDGW